MKVKPVKHLTNSKMVIRKFEGGLYINCLITPYSQAWTGVKILNIQNSFERLLCESFRTFRKESKARKSVLLIRVLLLFLYLFSISGNILKPPDVTSALTFARSCFIHRKGRSTSGNRIRMISPSSLVCLYLRCLNE